jgi:hypothetical protein
VAGAAGVNDLVAFVTARLDERERAARAATPGPWEAQWWCVQTAYDFDRPGYAHHGERVLIARNSGTVGNRQAEERNVEHIALHEPASVLADIAAKRAILDEHQPVKVTYWHIPMCSTCTDPAADSIDDPMGSDGPWTPNAEHPCRTVRLMATPYVQHPDFRDEWRVQTP